MKVAQLSVRLLEFIFPWTILLPFSFFLYSPYPHSCYSSIRTAVIKDAQSGRIKNCFLNTWLKENTLNKAILASRKTRQSALRLLTATIKYQSVLTQANGLAYEISTHQLIVEQIQSCFNRAMAELPQSKRSDVKEIKEMIPSIMAEEAITSFMNYEFDTYSMDNAKLNKLFFN